MGLLKIVLPCVLLLRAPTWAQTQGYRGCDGLRPFAGIPMEPVEEASSLDAVGILGLFVLHRGTRETAEFLFAYGPALACDTGSLRVEGPVALVFEDERRGPLAFYFPSLAEAASTARGCANLCGGDDPWSVATRRPIEQLEHERAFYTANPVTIWRIRNDRAFRNQR